MYSMSVGEEQQAYDAPVTWTEQIENGNVTYRIEAVIEVPDVTQYPIIEVEPAYFDYDALDRMIYQLVPDADIHIEDAQVWTKAQYQQYEIDVILAAIENVDVNHPDLSEEAKVAYIKDREAELARVMVLYNAAPEQRDAVRINSLSQMKGQSEYIRTANVYDASGHIFCNVTLSDPQRLPPSPYLDIYLRAGSYDVESRRFVETNRMQYPVLDLDNERVSAAATEFIRLVSLDDTYQLNGIFQDRGYGEAGVFVQAHGGIPATYALSNAAVSQPTYEYAWGSEYLMVYVDASYNVCRVIWQNPDRERKTIDSNVSLLSFSRIQDIIRSNLRYFEPDYPYWDDILHRTLVIERITLGMMRVKRIQSVEEYVVIPVWDCFGYYVDHYESQDKSGYVLDENNDAVVDENGGIGSFLTINAIDGSIIDRHLGY